MNKKIIILGTIATGAIITATVVPIVLLNNKEEKIEKDNVIYANKLKALKTKIVTISATSGDVTTNKNAILNKIKSLDNFPKLPKGITLDVKDSNQKLTISGVAIILIVKKEGETDIEIKDFKVKRVQSDQEIVDNYATKLKALKIKEVTIDATSGSVDSNNDEIKEKIKSLNNFPTLPNDVILEIKESPIKVSISGVAIDLLIKKGIITKEVRGFNVKRSKSNQEIVDSYKSDLLARIAQKDRTIKIAATSGTITSKKTDIINKIERIKGFVAKPVGVVLEVKEDSTQITTEGILISLVIKKDLAKTEIGTSENFKVKRSKSNQEIVDNYKNDLLVGITQENRTIKIDATSGTITSKKVDIISKIEKIKGFVAKPTGVILEVKDDSTQITLEGILITLVIKKDLAKTEIATSENFKVKRSKSNQEIVDNYKNDLLVGITQENRTIKIDATSGTITSKKADIIHKIERIKGFVAKPTGVILEVKEDVAQITPEGTLITLVIKKDSTETEIGTTENFKVKRSLSSQEIVNNYASKLSSISKEVIVPISSSSTITEKKNDILNAIKGLSNFPKLPTSLTLDIKDSNSQLTTTSVAIILIIKKDGVNDKEVSGFTVKRAQNDQEIIDIYKNLLLDAIKAENRIVKIAATSGTITSKKNDIIKKIEETKGFISKPEGVSLEVEDDPTQITTEGIAITLVIKKGSAKTKIGSNIADPFKVKRTKTASELATDSIEDVKEILHAKILKIVTITNLQAKVDSLGVANKIKAKVEEQIGSENLNGVIVSISSDATNADILDTGTGVGFKITLSKVDASPVEITNWKVKREKIQAEKDIDSIKAIFDGFSSKIVTIVNLQAKVNSIGASAKIGVSDKIVNALRAKINQDNLKGVTISIKPNTANEDIIDTGNGIGFIITLSKGDAPLVEITDWKVKREKIQDEKDIDEVKEIFDGVVLASKIVTITNLQAKVDALGVSAKIVEALKAKIVEDNLKGVTISIKPNNANEDIIDTDNGIGFIITLSKGDAPLVEITDWKVKREKIQDEKDIDAVKAIFDGINLASKNITVTFHFDSPYEIVNNEIVKVLKVKINENNLKGVTIAIKPSSLINRDLFKDTSQRVGFIITLSKGKAPVIEITDWKLKRNKDSYEINNDSIKRVLAILDSKSSKIVTITNLEAKISSPEVANKIKAEVIKQIGKNNLEGVKIKIVEFYEGDILSTGAETAFVMHFTKKPSNTFIRTRWKVKREKIQDEKDIDSIKTIFDQQSSKIVTITNIQAKVDTLGVSTKIVNALKAKINQSNLKGVTISVKPDSKNADIIDTGEGVGFIISLSKGEAPPIEIVDWKVKREKTQDEKDLEAVKLDFETRLDKTIRIIVDGPIKVENVVAKNKIITELRTIITDLKGVTISLKPNLANEVITDSGIGFIITLSKGEAPLIEITDWKVKGFRNQDQITLDIIKEKTKNFGEDEKVLEYVYFNSDVNVSEIETKLINSFKAYFAALDWIDENIKQSLTISIKPNTIDKNIIATGQKDKLTVIISKGQDSVEFFAQVKLIRNQVEKDIYDVRDEIFKNPNGLANKNKIFITNLQAKVDVQGVSNKIIENLKVGINLKGVSLTVESDTKNEDITDEKGVGFILLLSKGDKTLKITHLKVQRLKTQDEKDLEIAREKFEEQKYIINVSVTLINNSKINALNYANNLESEQQEGTINHPYYGFPSGLIINIVPNPEDGENLKEGHRFKVTLSKGEAPPIDISDLCKIAIY